MTLPTQDRATSVQGVALRVSRCNADGTLKTGTDSAYVMDRFVTATYTPAYDGGNQITLQGANGNMLVNYSTKATLLRTDLTVAVADPDPQFNEIVAGGTIFVDNTVPLSPVAVGWAPAAEGTVSNPNGCALEIWSNAITQGRRAAVRPFNQYVFPRVYLDPTGDHVFENGAMGQEFTGYGESNTGFGTGPDTLWDWTSQRPYQHARVDTAPTGINGYQAIV